MTTRWRQKASTALVIVGGFALLLLLLIFLWSAGRNGVFSEKSQTSAANGIMQNRVEMNGSVDVAGVGEEQRHGNPIVLTAYPDSATEDSASGAASIASAKPQLTFLTTTSTTTHSPVEMREHMAGQSNMELVRPSKLPPRPFHDQEMLFEMRMKDSAGYKSPNVITDVTTGSYRKSSNRVWDAYPEYLISAFGLHLDVQLRQNNDFISKDLKISHVTHISENETHIQHEPNENVAQLHGCFYTGHVKGDEHSKVSVSLCDGMRGYIYTSFGSFFIEPIEAYSVANPQVLHRISRTQTLPDREHQHPHHANCDVVSGDTSVGGATDFDTDTSNEDYNLHFRSKRSVLGMSQHHAQLKNPYIIRVLVGVDTKMQEFHNENNSNLKEYILMLMSVVSDVYSDPSIGNAIRISVVDILYTGTLYKEQHRRSNEGISAAKVLERFCAYVLQNSRQKHDVAVLLTREQLCRDQFNNGRCDTLGLAFVGTLCKDNACAIVQDTGLAAAFTIAHELGHVLNIPHDDDEKCNSYRYHDDTRNIMSAGLGNNVHPWMWSECSRNYVTDFLEHKYGLCLINQREVIGETDIGSTGGGKLEMPGEMFTASKQCQLSYGTNWNICSFMLESNQTYSACNQLWCGIYDDNNNTDSNGCVSLHMPWADGTPCTMVGNPHEHWCQRRECVPRNPHALLKVAGGWGEWSPYTMCSRTCGGGVTSTKRECNSPTPVNGGMYCLGERIRYKSCNTEACPPGEPDFRTQQCSSFNSNNFNIIGIAHDVQWLPKYDGHSDDQCKLVCRTATSNHGHMLNTKVLDGTLCTRNSFNKCVNGYCLPAACDNHLYSKAQLDKCGICNGNHDTCIDVIKTLHKDQLMQLMQQTNHKEYHDVVLIPSGSLNIEIVQMGHPNDLNFIALMADNGTYLLNGNSIIQTYPIEFDYGGVTFNYSGSHTTTEWVKSIHIRKLTRELRVQIFSRLDKYRYDDIISCKYTMPLPDPQPQYKSSMSTSPSTTPTPTMTTPATTTTTMQMVQMQFSWSTSEFSKCNKICRGTMFRSVKCIQLQSNEYRTVNAVNCYLPRPTSEMPCNTNCKLYWRIVDCPADCKYAKRASALQCIKETNQFGVHVRRIHCKYIPKPADPKCTGRCMQYDEWSECCNGQTHQHRNSYCKAHPRSHMMLPDEDCKGLQQAEKTRACRVADCKVQWQLDHSVPCSVTCGIGVRMPQYNCVQNNQIVNSHLCASLPKMDSSVTHCSMSACPSTTVQTTAVAELTTPIPQSYTWRSSEWTPCSATCGGIRQRNVYCLNDRTDEPMDERYCLEQRPIDEVKCNHQSPCAGWSVGKWNECNNDDCYRHRNVRCLMGTKIVDDDLCRGSDAPVRKERCCNFKWHYSWTKCSKKCGEGIRHLIPACMRVEKNKQSRTPTFVESSHCAYIKKRNKITQKCTVPCLPLWRSTPWSKCSSGCGKGYMTREVKCMSSLTVVSDRQCSATPKPNVNLECISIDDCSWKEHSWSNCTCTGTRKRLVQCYDNHEGKPSYSCPNRTRPPMQGACEPPPNCSCKSLQTYTNSRANGEYELLVNGKAVSIYCHDMNHADPKEYITLSPHQNYAMYSDRRAFDQRQCPYHEREMYTDNMPLSGTTYFEKVRLELRGLRVIQDDYQFVRHSGARRQSLGSAGDCFSQMEGCVQGRFQISLSGTPFRLSPFTKWDVTSNATINYENPLQSPYKMVSGSCGGFCGSCFINKKIGLKLEIED